LGVKRGAASNKKLDVFRKFIDGVNQQHWTLVKEREVIIGGDDDDMIFDFFGSMAARQKLESFHGEDIIFCWCKLHKAIIDDPQTVARALGADKSISTKEKFWGAIGMGSLVATTTLVPFFVF
jgi:hypothetical protein